MILHLRLWGGSKLPSGDWQSGQESGLLSLRTWDYFLPDMSHSTQAMPFPNDSPKDARFMSRNGLMLPP